MAVSFFVTCFGHCCCFELVAFSKKWYCINSVQEGASLGVGDAVLVLCSS